MKARLHQIIYVLLGVLLVGGGTWLWFEFMEKRWTAEWNHSTAARENPILAATRLLGQHQHPVKVEATLGTALLAPLPDGTMILTENWGIIAPDQAIRLLEWVRQGNTLITRPKRDRLDMSDTDAPADDADKGVHKPDRSGAAKTEGGAGEGGGGGGGGADEDEEDEEDAGAEPAEAERKDAVAGDQAAKPSPRAELVETDPIGAYLDLGLKRPDGEECGCRKKSTSAPDDSKPKKKPIAPAGITLPGGTYPLQIEAASVNLSAGKQPRPTLFKDDEGKVVRVYAEGKGHIVMVANNYFDNESLRKHDHAELLLGLADLNAHAREVLIIRHASVLRWYQALWANFKLALISLACGLLLLFWTALRRFGPLLPEPVHDRRALIEHIEASGRWLWKVPGGRDILLGAARASVNRLLQRRAPELHGLTPDEQVTRLAQSCGLARAAVAGALHQPASASPQEFTRQIKTLQQLRKHYER